MYDDLIKSGSISVTDALNVGITIEVTDINDLNDALKVTDNRDITRVYKNLRAGSENHLEAFESKL
jgi:hypothetical protein